VRLRRAPSCPDLHTFNDAVVAFRAGAESLKRLFVSLTFVGRQRDIVAVEFDNHSPQLQSGFVGLNLARGPGQKAPAKLTEPPALLMPHRPLRLIHPKLICRQPPNNPFALEPPALFR